MFEVLVTPYSKAPLTFDTLKEANAWLEQNIKLNSFGKPDRWVRESDFTGDESIDTATIDEETGVSSRTLDLEFDLPVTEYHFDCEYTYEIQDITEKYNKALRTQAKINKGGLRDLVSGIATNFILGCEDLEDSHPAFEPILDELKANKPKKARKLVEALGIDDIITEEVKSELLALLPEGVK